MGNLAQMLLCAAMVLLWIAAGVTGWKLRGRRANDHAWRNGYAAGKADTEREAHTTMPRHACRASASLLGSAPLAFIWNRRADILNLERRKN